MSRSDQIETKERVIPELAIVRLRADQRSSDGMFPAGSSGTVVMVYNDGEAYEVEFVGARAGLATVYAGDLEEAPEARS